MHIHSPEILVFGDQPPAALTFEVLDTWYHALVRKHGIDVAYRQ